MKNNDYMKTGFEEYAEEIFVDTKTGEKKVINKDPFNKESIKKKPVIENEEEKSIKA